MQLLENFIAGSFKASHDTRVREHHNPSDRRVVVSVIARGSSEDVAEATGAAADALKGWKALTAVTRGDHLHRWGLVIASKAEELAQAIVKEVGKPVSEARGEVARCSAILRYYAVQAVHPNGSVIPPQVAGALQFTRNEPLGVVALITPWNFPMAIPLWKAAPALAFGNTVVLKSSEYSSRCAWLLAETAREAGLPAGVFNVLHGEGAITGEALLNDPAISGMSFTGSHVTGARVAAIAAQRNIRYQTEMGGKNVAIVLNDADVERAATLAAAGGVRYAGQKCTATSRVIAERGISDKFNDALRQKLSELVLGPVDRSDCAVGPLIHEASRDKVLAFLSEVRAGSIEGGEVPPAGGGNGSAELEQGNYVSPALVHGVAPDSRIAQEEIFGPVMISFTADDADHAISLANGTRFGLSASLFTSNISRALHYITNIDVGMVRVNADTTGVDPHAPFGGMKSSSSGTREQGMAARDFYTAIKTIQINP